MVLGIKLDEIQHYETFWKCCGTSHHIWSMTSNTSVGTKQSVLKTAFRNWKTCQLQMQHLHFLILYTNAILTCQKNTEWLQINSPALEELCQPFQCVKNRIKSLVLHMKKKSNCFRLYLSIQCLPQKFPWTLTVGSPAQLLWILLWGAVYSHSKALRVSQPKSQGCIKVLASRDFGVRMPALES